MKKFNTGDVVIKQGSPGKEFYILVKGSVAIFKGSIKLAEYNQPGTVIGEISAILGTPRTASVMCLEPCEFITMDKLGEKEIKQHTDIVMYTLMNLAERLTATTDEFTTIIHRNRSKTLEQMNLL